MFFVYIHSY